MKHYRVCALTEGIVLFSRKNSEAYELSQWGRHVRWGFNTLLLRRAVSFIARKHSVNKEIRRYNVPSSGITPHFLKRMMVKWITSKLLREL